MRVSADEYLRLTIIEENNERLMDIRVWKRSPTGGVPTRKSLIVHKKFIIPMIRGLQRIHQSDSATEAEKSTEVAKG